MNLSIDHGLGAEIARRLNAAGISISANSVNNYLNGKHDSRFSADIEREKAQIIEQKKRSLAAQTRVIRAKLKALDAMMAAAEKIAEP